jgi:hypothetical protein
MKKEGQLATIAMIKVEAIKIELIQDERKKKYAVGTNRATNDKKNPVLIHQINEDGHDGIEAIRKNGYGCQSYNPNHQTKTNRSGSINALIKINLLCSGKMFFKIMSTQRPKQSKTQG